MSKSSSSKNTRGKSGWRNSCDLCSVRQLGSFCHILELKINGEAEGLKCGSQETLSKVLICPGHLVCSLTTSPEAIAMVKPQRWISSCAAESRIQTGLKWLLGHMHVAGTHNSHHASCLWCSITKCIQTLHALCSSHQQRLSLCCSVSSPVTIVIRYCCSDLI